MDSEANESLKKKVVVPNSESFNNQQTDFLFKAVKMKKKVQSKRMVMLKHPDSKTIANLIDALLEIDKKVLEKLA